MQFPNSKLLIFAKAPEPGQVKTRLAPALGFHGAAELYRELLTNTVGRLAESRVCEIECWCSPDTAHPLFQRLSKRYQIQLNVQYGVDLGARMGNAVRQALETADSVILVGADCPILGPDHLLSSLSWLAEGSDAVLGPAEDGGYVLFGLRRYDVSLFSDIEWGGDKVLNVTRQRMRALGWDWRELSPMWDLDRPEDLERYSLLNTV